MHEIAAGDSLDGELDGKGREVKGEKEEATLQEESVALLPRTMCIELRKI